MDILNFQTRDADYWKRKITEWEGNNVQAAELSRKPYCGKSPKWHNGTRHWPFCHPS